MTCWKLDRFKFAKLIAFIQKRCEEELEPEEIVTLDYLTEIETPEPMPNKADTESINNLLMLMKNAHNQITPAIKQYRAITGEELLEAKNAVERYRVTPMTKEVLVKKLNATNASGEQYIIIANFIESLNLPYRWIDHV